MENERPTFVVGIGGSAGALGAYKALLQSVSRATGMAFVIFAQMNPSANGALAQILARHTAMEVKIVTTTTSLEANHVYVNPSTADLRVDGETLHVVNPAARDKSSLDAFMTSLANAMGPRAIAIILSGYGGDGAAGCTTIKAKGGVTFAQDQSAEVDGMPRAAQDAGVIDFVLSPEQIGIELERLASKTVSAD